MAAALVLACDKSVNTNYASKPLQAVAYPIVQPILGKYFWVVAIKHCLIWDEVFSQVLVRVQVS